MKLLIVGDGYQLPDLSRMTVELGCEKDVIFTGSVSSSDVPTYISLMDICVMAKSNWYGSPVKIFEYGIMGKPIIAPDVQPVREVMNDGIDGLIRKDLVPDITQAISFLCEHDQEAKQMGKHFRNKILEQFTWDKVLSRIIS
jgi:glycosyltransferase involved in cell wall biosynthesis